MKEMLQHVFICVMQRKYKLTCYGIERIDYQYLEQQTITLGIKNNGFKIRTP